MLDYTPALNANLNVDDAGNTFAGVLQGKYRVYIDPYSSNLTSANGTPGNQYYVVGYKGTSPYDAGLFYCPYVPSRWFVPLERTPSSPRLDSRLVMVLLLTHSQKEPTLLLALSASIQTVTTDVLLLKTSCDPKDFKVIQRRVFGPSFLCLNNFSTLLFLLWTTNLIVQSGTGIGT